MGMLIHWRIFINSVAGVMLRRARNNDRGLGRWLRIFARYIFAVFGLHCFMDEHRIYAGAGVWYFAVFIELDKFNLLSLTFCLNVFLYVSSSMCFVFPIVTTSSTDSTLSKTSFTWNCFILFQPCATAALALSFAEYCVQPFIHFFCADRWDVS